MKQNATGTLNKEGNNNVCMEKGRGLMVICLEEPEDLVPLELHYIGEKSNIAM